MKWIGKILKRLLLLALILAVAACGLIIYQGKSMYEEAVSRQSIPDRVQELKESEDYVPLESISSYFLNAVVSIEDRNFYSHGAVSFSSTARAIINNLKSKSFSEGGSTITQQVAKNLCFSQEKKLSRKVAEIFAAIELENEFSKDQILEIYVNLNYYGDGYYGIRQASVGYFGTEPAYLTASQATLLAGLPQAPSVYALSGNAEKAYERQKEVVDSMVENRYISEEDAEWILSEKPYPPKSSTGSLSQRNVSSQEEEE